MRKQKVTEIKLILKAYKRESDSHAKMLLSGDNETVADVFPRLKPTHFSEVQIPFPLLQ